MTTLTTAALDYQRIAEAFVHPLKLRILALMAEPPPPRRMGEGSPEPARSPNNLSRRPRRAAGQRELPRPRTGEGWPDRTRRRQAAPGSARALLHARVIDERDAAVATRAPSHRARSASRREARMHNPYDFRTRDRRPAAAASAPSSCRRGALEPCQRLRTECTRGALHLERKHSSWPTPRPRAATEARAWVSRSPSSSWSAWAVRYAGQRARSR